MRAVFLLVGLLAMPALAHGPGGGPHRPSSGFNDEMIGLGTREGFIVNGRNSAPVPPGDFSSPRYVAAERLRVFVKPPEGRFTKVERTRPPKIEGGAVVGFGAPYAWRADPAGAREARISGIDKQGRTLLTPLP